MRSDGKRITREASRETGTFPFFPKGALTHHPAGAVVFPTEIVRSPRGCGFCGSLMDNATSLRAAVIVHAVGVWYALT